VDGTEDFPDVEIGDIVRLKEPQVEPMYKYAPKHWVYVYGIVVDIIRRRADGRVENVSLILFTEDGEIHHHQEEEGHDGWQPMACRPAYWDTHGSKYERVGGPGWNSIRRWCWKSRYPEWGHNVEGPPAG
jgi:hypothetical protein